MPDPKLKLAMEEIKAVLRKHDICAVVILSSPSHMEFLQEVEASWTCLKKEPGGLRIKALRSDFADCQSFNKKVADSVGTIAGFADAMKLSEQQLRGVLLHISNVIAFEHVTVNQGGGGKSFTISPGGQSITCHSCGRTSHNLNDVQNLYCGHCKKFHQFE